MEIRRRTVIQSAMVMLISIGFGANGYRATARARVTSAASIDPPPAEEPEPLIRYRFNCVDIHGTDIGHFSSLEEVWSTSQYMRITHCDVVYVGVGPHTLTAEEAAAVNVARDAGSPQPSDSVLCLEIIGACTRIDPNTLHADLLKLGAPVVKGAVTFAPLAPQAIVFSRWLGAVP
jgi:hypothetical protein